jgi:hypothetical protein
LHNLHITLQAPVPAIPKGLPKKYVINPLPPVLTTPDLPPIKFVPPQQHDYAFVLKFDFFFFF